MTRMRVRRINMRSLGMHACLLGAALSVLPSLLCGLVLLLGAHWAQQRIEGWRALPITLLGQEVAHADLVRVFGLERFIDILQHATTASPLVFLMAAVWLTMLAGLVAAALTLLAGLAYNGLALLTGGVAVEVSTGPEHSHRLGQEKAAWPRR